MLNINEVLTIKKHEIRARYKSIIYIDQKIYDNKTITETSTDYIIPGLINIYIPEFKDECQIITQYNINISKPTTIIENKNIIELHYDSNDLIIHQKVYDKNTDMSLIIKLFEGRAKHISNPELLLITLFNQLKNLAGIDLVHIELIISNMFRMKDNPKIKCRETGKFNNSVIIGQTAQPFTDSWLSSLGFMYIDKAIEQGLVKGEKATMDPLEKIMIEKF
jgi:hypothetical protein